MILGLKADSPVAEFYLCDSAGVRIAEEHWQADRTLAKNLLSRVEAFLASQGSTVKEISGLVVYKGPGSFTGLRIGLCVANTWAYANHIPIVGETGEAWLVDGLKALKNGRDDKGVLPLYASEPRITQPKK